MTPSTAVRNLPGMDREPDELASLDEDAIRLNELYHSLSRAGFSEREALYLTGLVLLRRIPDHLIAEIQEDADAAYHSLRLYLRPDDPHIGPD